MEELFLKEVSKKSVGLILGAFLLIIFILLIGIKDMIGTFALSDWEGFTALYIPEGTTAAPGEKVYVDLYADYHMWEYISISMKSTSSGDEFIVYLKNINSNKAYFVLPEPGNTQSSNPNGAKVGETYELRQVNLFGYCYNQSNCSNKTASYTTYPVEGKPSINSFNKKYVTVKDSNDEKINTGTQGMSIENFKLLNNNVQFDDKVYVDLKYSSSEEITGCSMWLRDNYSNVLYYALEDFKTKPYFKVDRTTDRKIPLAGTYDVVGLTCFVNNNKDRSYYYFTSLDPTLNSIQYDFNSTLVIKDSSTKPINSNFNISYFSLQDTEVSVGDTVNVIMPTNIGAPTILLTFYNKEADKTLPVYLKGLEKMYFVVPSTAEPGIYELQSIVVNNFEHIYTVLNNNGEAKLFEDQYLANNKLNIDFSKKLVIKDAVQNTKTLTINNGDFSEEVKNKIMALDEDAVITVYTYGSTVISKDMFEAIRETRKTLIIEYGESQWVFNGADIDNPKAIDVRMIVSDITSKKFNDSFINKLPSKAKLLIFSDNGELPGKVLIRLKSIDLDNLFGEDNLYIYYYDQDVDGLMKVAMEIQKNNGYYDFYINHNSDYVLVNKEIKENFVSDNTKYLDLNTKNNVKVDQDNNYMLYYIIGFVLVALMVTLLVIIKKKK